MSSLPAYLDAHCRSVVVPPDGFWVISYEFEGQFLLINAVDDSGSVPAAALQAAEDFVSSFGRSAINLRFGVSNSQVWFSINNGPRGATSLPDYLVTVFGRGVLRYQGAAKPVNVSEQVRSPFQLWQRQTLSNALVAQDFDAWSTRDRPVALEFKNVKVLDGWRPYVDDKPNFESLLRCMGPRSRIVIATSQQGVEVRPDSDIRAFLLGMRGDAVVAKALRCLTAESLVNDLDGQDDVDKLVTTELASGDWKEWRR